MTDTLRDRLAAVVLPQWVFDADPTSAQNIAYERADAVINALNEWNAEQSAVGDSDWDNAVDRFQRSRTATEADIDDAITQFVHTQTDGALITSWIVLAATTTADTSGLSTIYSGGEIPWPTALGLIEGARVRLHEQWRRDA